MVLVSNADRVVFPEVGRTKGEVVAYYERIGPKALVHACDRPLSIRRYPKGLAAPGFFQKNVPAHYPPSIERIAVAKNTPPARQRRGADKASNVTLYPLLRAAEHFAYLANQGAIELHVTNTRAPDLAHPDRFVIDLDPPAGAFALVQRAALLTRDALAEFGLASAPVATGSKGYHVVAALDQSASVEALALAGQKFAALLAARHPAELTAQFRIAARGERVFVDWLRNNASASVVAPYSLRATPRATVATPLSWGELPTTAPDAFAIGDLEQLLARPDPLSELSATASAAQAFVNAVDAAFERSGLVLEPFDRFRS